MKAPMRGHYEDGRALDGRDRADCAGLVVLWLLPCEAAVVPSSAFRVVAALVDVLAVAPPAGAQVGTVTEIPLGSGSDPYGIAVGGDGNLWFTTLSAGYIGRVTPAGTPTQFSAGISPGSPLRGIVGPDSNLWYVDDTGKIGRITPTGMVTQFSSGGDPYRATSGSRR
jgi:streptogramin lyase